MKRKDLIKRLRQIGRQYRTKVRFVELEAGGTVYRKPRLILIAKNWCRTNTKIANIFFHELAHLINADTNKYPIYHKALYSHTHKKFKATAWRAEKYTDKVAKKIQKEYFPKLSYSGYRKSDRPWFDSYWGWK